MVKTFMDLPPEIRNEIYSLCESLVPTEFIPNPPPISAKESVFISGYETRHGCLYVDCCCSPCLTKLSQPPLTRVSKTIRDETLSIFYGYNRFYFNTSNGSCVWFKRVRRYAQHITVVLGPSFGISNPMRFVLNMKLKGVICPPGVDIQ